MSEASNQFNNSYDFDPEYYSEARKSAFSSVIDHHDKKCNSTCASSNRNKYRESVVSKMDERSPHCIRNDCTKQSIEFEERSNGCTEIKVSDSSVLEGYRSPDLKTNQDSDTEPNALRKQLNTIMSELYQYRSQNQVLKRELLKARKVILREIGGNSLSFETLIRKGNEEGWMGRQETIYLLNRNIRALNKLIEQLGGSPSPIQRMKKRITISPADIPEDTRIHQNLCFERDNVIRNAERERQSLTEERERLKKKLKDLTYRNKSLKAQVVEVKEDINSANAKSVQDLETHPDNDNELQRSLRELQNKMKSCLESKAELRRISDDLEKQSHHYEKQICELKSKIHFENKMLTKSGAKLELMKAKEDELCDAANEMEAHKSENLQYFREELSKLEEAYLKKLKSFEVVASKIAKNKEWLLSLQNKSKPITDVDTKLTITPIDSLEDVSTNASEEHTNVTNSKPHITEFEDSNHQLTVDLKSSLEQSEGVLFEELETKSSSLATTFETMERRNLQKSKFFYDVIDKMEEMLKQLLCDHYILWKLSVRSQILNERMRALRGAQVQPLTSRKSRKINRSVLNTIEQIEDSKILWSVLKQESKLLTALIKYAISSAAQDFGVYNGRMLENKDMFLITCSDTLNKQ